MTYQSRNFIDNIPIFPTINYKMSCLLLIVCFLAESISSSTVLHILYVWSPCAVVHLNLTFHITTAPLSTQETRNHHSLVQRDDTRTWKMFPNPFDRKHSTIRQVFDKFLDGRKSARKNALSRKDSKCSSSSSQSNNSTPRKFFNSFSIRSWRNYIVLKLLDKST